MYVVFVRIPMASTLGCAVFALAELTEEILDRAFACACAYWLMCWRSLSREAFPPCWMCGSMSSGGRVSAMLVVIVGFGLGADANSSRSNAVVCSRGCIAG